MKTKLATIGLVAILGAGCSDKSVVNSETVLSQPYGCEQVLDIRATPSGYHLLCKDNNENLALFTSRGIAGGWNKTIVYK